MTIIKLDRFDRFMRKFSHAINKLGFKRTSGRLLNYILYRHGVPKNQSPVWLTKTHIEY